MGMVHYLGRYLPNLVDTHGKTRSRLTRGGDQAQTLAFTKVKQMLTEAPILVFYDVIKSAIISTAGHNYNGQQC